MIKPLRKKSRLHKNEFIIRPFIEFWTDRFSSLNWVTVWRHWQKHPRKFSCEFRISETMVHGPWVTHDGSDISWNDLASSTNSVSVHRCRPGILTWLFPSKLGYKIFIMNEIVQKRDLYSGEGIESQELGFFKQNTRSKFSVLDKPFVVRSYDHEIISFDSLELQIFRFRSLSSIFIPFPSDILETSQVYFNFRVYLCLTQFCRNVNSKLQSFFQSLFRNKLETRVKFIIMGAYNEKGRYFVNFDKNFLIKNFNLK